MTGPEPEIERAVSRCQRQLPETLGGDSVAFGFDGVVDTVREIIDERQDGAEYTPVTELAAVGDRIQESVDIKSSATFEWTEEATRTGGHVCHLTRALGTLEYEPTMIGTLGEPIDPVFRDEFERYPKVSIGQPGQTDAVEFDDGKLMLTQPGDYRTLDWETLCDCIDVADLAERIDGRRLLGLGYWSVTPSFPDLLDGLREELWPLLSSPPEHVLADPADLRHVPPADLRGGASAFAALDDVVEVTVSANRSECQVIASVFGDDVDEFEETVQVAREALGVHRFVGHGVDRSASSTATETASIAVPTVENHVLTTSAGDHFNAGLAVGLLTDVDEDAALVLGNSLAGWFVRNGTGPTRDQLRTFVDEYLDQFESVPADE
jgi:hypothetical protein